MLAQQLLLMKFLRKAHPTPNITHVRSLSPTHTAPTTLQTLTKTRLSKGFSWIKELPRKMVWYKIKTVVDPAEHRPLSLFSIAIVL